MLFPSRVKHRKMQKGRSRQKGIETRATELAFGTYGLKAMSYSWVTPNQIEAARRVLLRYFGNKGKIWIRIFPDKPISTKGNEVPMGGGKGAVDHYVFPVKPGRLIFEVDGIPEATAKEALRQAGFKFSAKTIIVTK